MPFTPFHLGPGILFKAALRERFSLASFAAMQVAMDVEPLIAILRDGDVLHGWTHTLHGGALLALMLTEPVRRCMNAAAPIGQRYFFRGRSWSRVERSAAWAGSVAGVASHVLLDAVMHADMRPFAWLAGNPLLGLMEVGMLHAGCLFAGLVGVLLLVVGTLDR